jgi:thymidylate synthase
VKVWRLNVQLTIVEAKTIPEAWFLCIQKLISLNETGAVDNIWQSGAGIHKYVIDRGSFEKTRRLEFDHITVRIEYPGSRPLVPDVPVGIPAPVTQEYIDNYLPLLMCNQKQENEEYTYGMYLEPQIDKVIRMYRGSGYNTNQATMTVGDLTSIDSKDPPCLRLIDTRILNNRLHFVVYFRSWDLWGGFPANLGGIQVLKEYMASMIGVDDGELIANSKGLHLYDKCWPLAYAVLRK